MLEEGDHEDHPACPSALKDSAKVGITARQAPNLSRMRAPEGHCLPNLVRGGLRTPKLASSRSFCASQLDVAARAFGTVPESAAQGDQGERRCQGTLL